MEVYIIIALVAVGMVILGYYMGNKAKNSMVNNYQQQLADLKALNEKQLSDLKALNEKRLTGQEESGDERVSCAKLGIDGFHYLKTHISQIAEDTTAVWQPSNFNTLARL